METVIHKQIIDSGCPGVVRQIYFAAVFNDTGWRQRELDALARAKFALDDYYARRVIELQGEGA